MKFCDKIKKLRVEKKMTQEEVANSIEISRRAYVAYEKGEAKPRSKLTYIKLAEVLDCDVEYLLKDEVITEKSLAIPLMSSLAAAVPIAGPLLVGGIVAAMTMSEREKMFRENRKLDPDEEKEESVTFSTEQLEKYNKLLQRFSATASGLIFGKMAQNGISFQVGSSKELGFKWCDEDMVIRLEDNTFDTWLIKYCALSVEDKLLDKFVYQMTSNAVSSLIFLPKDKKRKVSIVVNHKELLEYLLNLMKDNSYGGNLSIVYVDIEEVKIVDEVYVATLYNDNETTLMKII